MIEGLIRSVLITVPQISGYTDKIFRVSAPEGTKTPYIVINANDEPDDSDVLALFDIDINIYDYSENRTQIRSVSKAIKNALHFTEFPSFEEYETIRMYFKNRNTVKEKQSTLVNITLTFSARATENI